LILYSDEVVPGNALSHDNKRKVWVFYFSWMELGAATLQREESWLCCLVQRSSFVSSLESGVSQIAAAVCKLFFGDLHCDLSEGGMSLQHPNGDTFRLFCKIGMFLQDGGAHKLVWGCKGDAGTKICMLCRNLISMKSEVTDEAGESLVICNIWDEALLDMATDDDIRGSVRRVATASETMTQGAFKRFMQACGWTHCPRGLMLDEQLVDHIKPASQYCHDWMHCLLVHGVFQTVVHLLLTKLAVTDLPNIYQTLYEYLQLWTFPIGTNANIHELFSPKKKSANVKAKTFKCTASEGLTVYPILAYFLQAVCRPANICASEINAFLCLCDIIDMLQAVPRQIVTAEQLRTSIKLFISWCLNCDWSAWMHSKFHWMLHLPMHLQKFGMLPSCWVHERKHKVVKRYATGIHNTINYEGSIATEVLQHNLAYCSADSAFNFNIALTNPRVIKTALLKILSGMGLSVDPHYCFTSCEVQLASGGKCKQHDIVLAQINHGDHMCGKIVCHIQVDSRHLSCMSVFDLLSQDKEKRSAEWRCSAEWANCVLVSTEMILSSLTYSHTAANVIRTLIPFGSNFI